MKNKSTRVKFTESQKVAVKKAGIADDRSDSQLIRHAVKRYINSKRFKDETGMEIIFPGDREEGEKPQI